MDRREVQVAQVVPAEKRLIGYVNERMLSVLASGMVACTHISPTKTQFQQVAIYVEADK